MCVCCGAEVKGLKGQSDYTVGGGSYQTVKLPVDVK